MTGDLRNQIEREFSFWLTVSGVSPWLSGPVMRETIVVFHKGTCLLVSEKQQKRKGETRVPASSSRVQPSDLASLMRPHLLNIPPAPSRATGW